jgi:ACS family tartrate transporter-like MFS transporter
MSDEALSVRSKITRRLVAPLTFLTLLNTLDRVNVSFAALRMNADIHLTPERYGFGVGLFFVGYLACSFPHTALLKRFGAQRWICAAALAWGTVATCMACIQNAPQFYVLRVLLGVAEAGFAPGIIYITSQWMPRRFRAWAIAGSMLAVPISLVFGGPLSGWLMSANTGLPIAGWRFMFLVEGGVTLMAAAGAWFYFVDEAQQARWLTPDEKVWLLAELERDRTQNSSTTTGTFRALLRSVPVWAAGGVWFTLLAGAYGIIYWLPQVIKQLSGLSDLAVSIVNAVPWAALGAGMLLNAWHSDRTQERHWHIGAAALLAALGLLTAASLPPGWLSLVCLSVGALGLGGAQGAFWALPSTFLDPGQSARGITWINLFGSLGGLIVPPAIGFIRARSGSFTVSALALASLLVAGALLLLLIRPSAQPQHEVQHAIG